MDLAKSELALAVPAYVSTDSVYHKLDLIFSVVLQGQGKLLYLEAPGRVMSGLLAG